MANMQQLYITMIGGRCIPGIRPSRVCTHYTSTFFIQAFCVVTYMIRGHGCSGLDQIKGLLQAQFMSWHDIIR